jgi:RHS repeat-associated protein
MLVVIVTFGASNAAAEPMCTDTWTGANEGLWQTGSNWSTGKVPSSTDVTCIEAGKTVDVTAGTNQTGVLLDKGTVVILGGSLEIANALEASSANALTVQGGTLTGAGTLDISSSLSWSESGLMSGSGSTVLRSGASGTMVKGRLAKRTFVNEGTLTIGAVSGELAESEGAKVENKGTFNMNEAQRQAIVVEGSGAAPSFVNTGKLQKTELTELAAVEVNFENIGTISGGTGGVVFPASTTLSLGSSTLEGEIGIAGAAVSGAGFHATKASVTLSRGSLSLGSGSVTMKSLKFSGNASLTGAGTLDISDSLSWRKEGGKPTMSGSGSTVLQSGATGSLEEGGFLAGRTFINEGIFTIISSDLALSEGAIAENTGTFNVNQSQREAIVAEGSGAAPQFVNAGTFQKTENTESAAVEVNFENLGGIVEHTSGKIFIKHPITASASTAWGGTNLSAPGHPHLKCGDPVDCATGNYSETQTDLSVGGRGVGLGIVRTYNSQMAAEGTKGSFGYGWTSSFSDHLMVEKESKKATLVQANGSTVSFTEGTGGSFTAPVWTQDTLSGTSETGYTLTLANQVKYKFAGSSGRLESVTDRNGNETSLTYSGAGRLESIADPAGRKITLAYNSEGLVESAKDPMGHTAKYTYEGGNLASVTLPGETTARWQFKYDTSHEITEMIDGRGGKTINEYNGAHQVILQKDPAEHTLTFEYEGFHTTITNKTTGSVTDEHYTSNYEPVSITHGFGTSSATTTSLTYNAGGYITSETDGNNHTTKYGYSSSNDRTSMVDPNEHETKWTYNSTHDVETMTTPNGETTTIKRDSHGNAESVSRPAPGSKTQTTKYKYDTHGDLESVTDALERTWKYEYNTHGDRTSETDPATDKRTWEYNEDSQETATVSPRGHVKVGEEAKYTTKIERDEQGRQIKITNPLGHTTKYEYDKDGNLEVQTDPNGHKTTYTYNADNQPTKVKAANGTTTETEYDGAGQVTSATDGNKNTTKYMRNAVGEVIEVTDPLGRKTTKEYDNAGNLKSLTDPAKRTTTYKYDKADRLEEVSYSDGKTPAVKYEYDADGNRKTMTDGTGKTTYTYDQLDRLTETENGHKEVVKYEYDLANQQTKITYPNGKTVTRAYDKAGRLETVTDWLTNATKFAYNADSGLTTTTFPTATGNVDKYSYNEADQMTEAKMTKGTETLASLVYIRDNDNQLKKTTSKGLPGAEIIENIYDENNRLTKAGTIAYEYNPANNPTKIETSKYTYDKASELETGPSLKYTYDEAGERTKTTPTTGVATTYGYDQAGNLTSVERPKEGEKAEIKDTYAYDGNALRASQTISGKTTYLTWDMTESLPLILGDGTNSYIYGPGGLPIEQINGTGTVLYLHHDQQGSTRMLTGSTGKNEATFTYDAYGNQTGHTGTAATPLDYDGQYTSADTGLIYLRARAYDPITAQFLNVDPIAGLTQAPYNYATDNPVNKFDPTGLCDINPFGSESCVSAVVTTVKNGVSEGFHAVKEGVETVGEGVEAVGQGVQEGAEAAGTFAEQHPVVTGIALGTLAVATGGGALVVESTLAAGALGTVSFLSGGAATYIDGSKCLAGNGEACIGAGLGSAGLALGAPEFLASTGIVEETGAFRSLAAAGLGAGAAGTLWDGLSGLPGGSEGLFAGEAGVWTNVQTLGC